MPTITDIIEIDSFIDDEDELTEEELEDKYDALDRRADEAWDSRHDD